MRQVRRRQAGTDPQTHKRRAPSAGFRGRIAVILHERGPGEYASDEFPLQSDAPAVNDSQRGEAQSVRLDEILFDDCFDIARRNGVQVENIGDGNTEWLR